MNIPRNNTVRIAIAVILGQVFAAPFALRAETRTTGVSGTPKPDETATENPQEPAISETKPKKKAGKIQLTSDDGRFSVRPLVLVQPIVILPIDSEKESPSEGSGVLLKRARLGAEATLFEIASVKIWGDFRNGTPELVDAYVDVDPLDGSLIVRAGWFRPWFGRQRIGSAAKSLLTETAMAWSDKRLGLNLNRDIGISLFGIAANFFEWGVGIFNGEKTFTLGENRDMGMAARIAVHPLAPVSGMCLTPGDETALKMSENPALSVGGSLSFESRRDRSIAPDPNLDPLGYEDIQIKVGGEVAFHWSRLTLQSELFWMKTVVDEGANAETSVAIDAEVPTAALQGAGMGTYLQIGIMAVRDRLELSGRFDWVDEHLETDGARFYPAFGTNVYIKGHNLKLQAFYRAEIAVGYEEAHPAFRDRPSHLLELMLQAGF